MIIVVTKLYVLFLSHIGDFVHCLESNTGETDGSSDNKITRTCDHDVSGECIFQNRYIHNEHDQWVRHCYISTWNMWDS